MATHLTLLCSSATASSRAGGFPGPDEPLDDGGREKARRRTVARRPETVMRSPARAAGETAKAMGWTARVEPRLADMDFGAWNGRSFAEVHATQPDELARWIAKPEDGAPGGETLDDLRVRVRPWLAEIAESGPGLLAITHATTIRAILAEALDLPGRSVMRFDIAPLSLTSLSFHRVWRLQGLSAD